MKRTRIHNFSELEPGMVLIFSKSPSSGYCRVILDIDRRLETYAYLSFIVEVKKVMGLINHPAYSGLVGSGVYLYEGRHKDTILAAVARYQSKIRRLSRK